LLRSSRWEENLQPDGTRLDVVDEGVRRLPFWEGGAAVAALGVLRGEAIFPRRYQRSNSPTDRLEERQPAENETVVLGRLFLHQTTGRVSSHDLELIPS
jgi:hypothetical protein